MIRVDDELLVVPGERAVRVRGLESLHEGRTKVGPGNRLAVNLGGIDHGELQRGDVLISEGQWHLTRRVDASVTVLNSLDHPLTRRGAHVAYIGSGEHPVRVRVLGPAAIDPGSGGAVRLHLPTALPLTPGDRFILREFGRGETVGGGEILDIDPVLPASRARPDRSTDRVVAERGRVDADRLELLTGERRPPDVGRWVVSPDVLDRQIRSAMASMAEAGPLGIDLAGLVEFERAVMESLDGITVEGGRVRLADSVDPLADHPYIAALTASLFSPPRPEGIDRTELRELVRRGDIVDLDGVYFAAAAVDQAAAQVARLLDDHPEGVTVAQVRDAWVTSRKFALPLLGHLDATGVTRRRGDLRIGGPRLPKSG
jgi:selenocysteine-specific elongation factor